MLEAGYDVSKAAQVVAYFALKSDERKINILKVAKLLYLAERTFMEWYDEPMFYDKLTSMPDGPVTSITLDLIKGHVGHPTWLRYVAPRQGYFVGTANGIDETAKLIDLSAADIEILNHLWGKFGGLNQYQLRDWTHEEENIPEWVDPNGSSYPILHRDVFEFLGKENVEFLAQQIDQHRELSASLNSTE